MKKSSDTFGKGDTKMMSDRAWKVFIDKYYNNKYSINGEKDGFPNL
jgi:hypothetical protein